MCECTSYTLMDIYSRICGGTLGNCSCLWKWTQRSKFKPRTTLRAYHIALIRGAYNKSPDFSYGHLKLL